MTFAAKVRHFGRIATDTRWWPFYLQRRFMRPRSRAYVGRIIASRLRPRSAFQLREHSNTKSPAVIRHGAAIQTAGVTLLGRLLTTGQAGELQHYFGAKPVYDPYRSEASRFLPDSDERHPESHVAYHDARDVVSAPYLLDIANRPDILEIVSDFLGCQPTLSYLAAWWSYQTHVGPQQAECFHRDVDDWRFLKLFVYLTDVEPDNGPHVYVRHSSRSSRLREIRRFADSEVVEAFGGESVLRVTGQAGEGFLEDTFGIHKGQPVARGKRLIFQAVYSMFPLPYGPSVPIANLHQVSLSGERRPDRWINRLYLRS